MTLYAYKVCLTLRDSTRISRVIHAPSEAEARACMADKYAGQFEGECLTVEKIGDNY